jgi:transposase
VKTYDKEIQEQADSDPMCIEVQKIEGVGPLTASAMVASIGDASVFNNGREVSAWLGLVPKQHSSGNKVRLGGISKRGDRYLKTLLIHGARSALTRCEGREDKKNKWAAEVKQRCGFNKAAVALANKNARTIWALMAHGECYRASDIQESVAV